MPILTFPEIKQLWTHCGGAAGGDADTAAALALVLSMGDTQCSGPRSDGTIGVGLWQLEGEFDGPEAQASHMVAKMKTGDWASVVGSVYAEGKWRQLIPSTQDDDDW